jgi:hypothetical protein
VQLYRAFADRIRFDDEDAVECGDRIVQIGVDHGFAEYQLLGAMYRQTVQVLRGEITIDQYEQTINIWRSMGGGMLLPFSMAQIALLRADNGELDRAQDNLTEAEKLVRWTGQDAATPLIEATKLFLAARTGTLDPSWLQRALAAARAAFDRGSALLAARILLVCSSELDLNTQSGETALLLSGLRDALARSRSPEGDWLRGVDLSPRDMAR